MSGEVARDRSGDPGAEALRPGHFWKTPFLWTPGAAGRDAFASDEHAKASPPLAFVAADPAWLESAVAEVMAASADPSDQAAIAELGATGAARELLQVPEDHFEIPAGGWLRAEAGPGQAVGVVLLALLKPRPGAGEAPRRATIYYMGVLPASRGQGYAVALLREAMRQCQALRCGQLFCDTGSDNVPMVRAFRTAGFEERAPWQRPLR